MSYLDARKNIKSLPYIGIGLKQFVIKDWSEALRLLKASRMEAHPLKKPKVGEKIFSALCPPTSDV